MKSNCKGTEVVIIDYEVTYIQNILLRQSSRKMYLCFGGPLLLYFEGPQVLSD